MEEIPIYLMHHKDREGRRGSALCVYTLSLTAEHVSHTNIPRPIEAAKDTVEPGGNA